MKKRLLPVMLLAAFLTLFTAVPFAGAEPLEEVRNLVKERYVDDVPDHVLNKPRIADILTELDPYSVYMSKKEYASFIDDIEQRITGIGVVLEEEARGVKIMSVIPESPAEKAGLKAGDVITHVSDKSIAGKSVQMAASLIGGEEGTAVKLHLIRGAEKLIKSMTRKEISLPTVESEMLGGNIGYIRLHSFHADAGREMAKAIRALPDAERFIVDFRNNGGGFTTAAQDVAGLFEDVPYAFLLREKGKAPDLYPAKSTGVYLPADTALLINGFSASASEMVAGTVKEYKSAVLYGQNSYGKGSMQSLYTFPDGSVLKLTTARFYSPGGTISADSKGVQPDRKTEEGRELTEAHFDLLTKQLTSYRELPGLKKVPVTKNFTVSMNTKMDRSTVTPDAVRLIQLGGGEVSVKTSMKDEKTILIAPEEKLQPGGEYVLIIHPKWQDTYQRQPKNGVYLQVTVQ